MGRTNDDARRLESEVDSMRAIMALRRSTVFRVDVNRVVRARLKACLASDANSRIELHNAVVPLIHRGDWTDPDAGWIRAVITPRDLEVPPRIGSRAGLDVLHPRPIYTKRNVVFALARSRAGVASNARPIIDDESEVHERPRPT